MLQTNKFNRLEFVVTAISRVFYIIENPVPQKVRTVQTSRFRPDKYRPLQDPTDLFGIKTDRLFNNRIIRQPPLSFEKETKTDEMTDIQSNKKRKSYYNFCISIFTT